MKKYLFSFLVVFGVNLLFSQKTEPTLKLASLFTDNMILQQKTEVPVWGWIKPGEVVTIQGSWMNSKVKVSSDKEGKWITKIKTPKAGGPYTLRIEGDTIFNLINVLIGEVWVCSGQSNMEMTFNGYGDGQEPVKDAEEIVSSANIPNIRLFKVQHNATIEPKNLCTGKWDICSPTIVKDFSAVGYTFIKELYNKMKIPIGIIMSTWGGTPAQSWTKIEDLLKYPEFKTIIESYSKPKDTIKFKKDVKEWYYKIGINNLDFQSTKEKWMNKDYDDTKWDKVIIPSVWSKTNLNNFTGGVWFRKTIDIPLDWINKELTLELGPIDEMDITCINGIKIGENLSVSDWTKKRTYTILSDQVQPGKNVIAIRVTNLFGEGGIYGKPEQLLIYPTERGSEKTISLAGEWLYRIDFKADKVPPFPQDPNEISAYQSPAVLFNGMISPLIPYRIQGAIWYQGEANMTNPDLYTRLFPDMVKSWRNNWKQGNFPFYYVQIAPFKYNSIDNSKSTNSAFLRESQFKSLKIIENSGMAVTMDVGSATSIHPPDKETVGKRLSLWALNKIYGFKDLCFSGPLYKSMKIENDKIRIYFDNATKGLLLKDGDLTNFTICGKDTVFVPADAFIENNSVIVSNPSIKSPLAVRYCWSNTAESKLFNKEGLPASSFRTDKWDK